MRLAGNLIGRRLRNVIIVAQGPSIAARQTTWLLRCDCGHEFLVARNRVWRFQFSSWRFRCPRCTGRKCPTRKSYKAMLRRKSKHGAKVSQRWLGQIGYDNFVRDMGLRPAGTVLDRKKINGWYSRRNCRWASYKLSTENRTNTVWLRVPGFGKRKRVKEWSELTGLPEQRIYSRLAMGWSPADIISRPIGSQGKQ